MGYRQRILTAFGVLLFAGTLTLTMNDAALARERWVTHGPYGGSTAVLLPSNEADGGLYAGVLGHGVYYRSSAAARTWVRRSNGLDNLYVKALVQHPLDPNILYAGVRDGVYWTTDGGLNWELRSGGLNVSHVEALAIDPTDPQVLYAGAIWAANWGVYKTTNGGETWQPTGSGIPVELQIRSILVDPVDGQTVYVGTADPYNYLPDEAGVYKSVNAGADWFPSGNGLLNKRVQTLVFDPQDRQTIYSGNNGSEYVPFPGVYVSEDAGANWSWISEGLPTDAELELNGIGVCYEDDSDVPALYAAASYGCSLPYPPNGWESRLYKSTDGGGTWKRSSSGVAFPNLLSVVVDPADPHVVYAGSECGGVFRSADFGANWTHWSTGLERLLVRGLTVHPYDENTVYAGAVSYDDEFSDRGAGVYVSFDGGLNWEPRPKDMRVGGYSIHSLAVAAGESDPYVVYAANCGWMMYKSIDEGISWSWRGFLHGIDGYWLRCVVVDPSDPRIAYVSGAGFEPSYPDIYKTVDWGETWQPVASYLVWGEFMGLAIDPTDTETVYAGSGWEGVYKTTNGGQTWNLTGPEILETAVNSIVVDPQSPEHVYAGDNQWEATGMYVSYDAGGTWERYNEGLLVLDIEAVTIDSVGEASPEEYPPVLYAGTEGGGVFERRVGQPWMAINEGLEELRVYSLALGPPRTFVPVVGPRRALYAGTADGVYRRVGSGDFDADGDVDNEDFLAFVDCFSGPEGDPISEDCEPADFDGDGEIDCDDWNQFLLAWTEPGDPPSFAECPLVSPKPAAPPDDVPKNRYISFEPDNAGLNVAFQVELTASTYFPDSVGPVGWVGEPDENGIARVAAEPHYADNWPATVHVGDCPVVPAATFAVRATEDETYFSLPLAVSTIAQPAPKYWGDVAGSFEGSAWTGPDGAVNMDDVMAAIQGFQQLPVAPPLTWVDVEPEVPNAVLNFTDIFQVVEGFKGNEYPFSAPEACP